MRPDLSDPEAREVYRRELKGLARGWRLLGFLMVLLGAGGILYGRLEAPWDERLRTVSWLLIAGGWIVFIGVIIYRTHYHKGRMAED